MPGMPAEDRHHDGTSPHEATINYTLSDCGDHYTITPRCYFETKGSRAKVKCDKATGRLSIKPARPVADKELNKPGVTKFINGGYLYLPKKCDISKDPIVRHEGPVGQLLVIDFPKLPQFCTARKEIVHC